MVTANLGRSISLSYTVAPREILIFVITGIAGSAHYEIVPVIIVTVRCYKEHPVDNDVPLLVVGGVVDRPR